MVARSGWQVPPFRRSSVLGVLRVEVQTKASQQFFGFSDSPDDFRISLELLELGPWHVSDGFHGSVELVDEPVSRFGRAGDAQHRRIDRRDVFGEVCASDRISKDHPELSKIF